MNWIKTLKKAYLILAFGFIAMASSSCQHMFKEDLPECKVDCRLKFRFDMNLMWADAFYSHVNSVTVYAYDKDGVLRWSKSDKGFIDNQGYFMDLSDVPAGDYELVAWCGLENDNEKNHPESFIVNPQTHHSSKREDIHCRMEREYDEEGNAYSDKNLYDLYYGTVNVAIPDAAKEGQNLERVFTLPVMKDTNHVRVMLQHLSGKDIDTNDFQFRIEDVNGHLHHDNTLRDDEPITYKEWNKENGEAGIPGQRSDEITNIKVALADLSVSRLTNDHDVFLSVYNPEGKRIIHIPLVDFALMTKGYYSRPMGDQEFLDRQDHYELVFFLDDNNEWLSATIYINSWRLVLHNYDV